MIWVALVLGLGPFIPVLCYWLEVRHDERSRSVSPPSSNSWEYD